MLLRRCALDALDTQIRKRIINKIGTYCATGKLLTFAKPLSGELRGLFRFRSGDYRAIFRNDAHGEITILFILTIKHRREAYDN